MKRKPKPKMERKRRYRYRNAMTGRFTRKLFAENHRAITVRERV